MWHLGWLVRTRADNSLWPSGLVRPRTDIKSWLSTLVRTRTDIKLRLIEIGKIIQGLRANIHTNLFKLSFDHFLEVQGAIQKKRPNDNLNEFVCIFTLASVLV